MFDGDQLALSHGHDHLDAVAREAFVNHVHFTGPERRSEANRLVDSWRSQLNSGWPGATFRIYWVTTPGEVTVRFHRVREGLPNWADEGVEVIEVRT